MSKISWIESNVTIRIREVLLNNPQCRQFYIAKGNYASSEASWKRGNLFESEERERETKGRREGEKTWGKRESLDEGRGKCFCHYVLSLERDFPRFFHSFSLLHPSRRSATLLNSYFSGFIPRNIPIQSGNNAFDKSSRRHLQNTQDEHWKRGFVSETSEESQRFLLRIIKHWNSFLEFELGNFYFLLCVK